MLAHWYTLLLRRAGPPSDPTVRAIVWVPPAEARTWRAPVETRTWRAPEVTRRKATP
jgi:hypothetical protein